MTFHWESDAGAAGIDPITEFRLDHDRATRPDRSESRWWSAIVALDNTSIDAFEALARQRFPGDLLVPTVYDQTDRAAVPPEQAVSLFARAPLLKEMNRAGNRFGVSTVHLSSMVPEKHLSFPTGDPEPEPGPDIHWEDGTVLTAVIDDGIAFANSLFRDGPASSRVQSVFIMAAPTDDPPCPEHRRSTRGITLSKQCIDRILQANMRNGLLDEDNFYRQVRLIDYRSGAFSPAALHRSHGTGVMALAAGYPMNDQPRHPRPIICAILPAAVTADTSGHNLLAELKYAIKHLEKQAERHKYSNGDPVPVVLNFSYGGYGGPHDGTGKVPVVFESLFPKESGDPPKPSPFCFTPVVLPAGNGNLDRIHARVLLDPSAGQEYVRLNLNVSPNDRTASHVQIWIPAWPTDPPKPPSIRVETPWGVMSPEIDLESHSDTKALKDHAGRRAGKLSWWQTTEHPLYRGVLALSLNPTEKMPTTQSESLLPLAPPGVWRIHFSGSGYGEENPIKVWVLRDDTVPGYLPNGRQARFESDDYASFDAYGKPLGSDPADTKCPIRRGGTMTGFADPDLERTIVIGGLTTNCREGLMSDYSATGQMHPVPLLPTASAKSDESPALPGVLTTGTRSGSMVSMSGTSMAAPTVARHIAEKLATVADRPQKFDVSGWVEDEAKRQDSHYRSPKPKPVRTGHGRLTWQVNFTGVQRKDCL